MIPRINDSKEDFDDDELAYAIEQTKQIKWHHRVLLNQPLRVAIAFIIASVITPILVYRYMFFPSLDLPPSDGFSFGSCLVPRESRIPCGIGTGTPDQCHPQCCYNTNNRSCFHRFPSRFSYLLNTDWTEEVLLNPRVPITPYASQRSYTNIRMSIDEVSATHLSLAFYPSHLNITGRRIADKKYNYSVLHPEMNVIVNSSQGNIFNLARGPLIASENIWDVSFIITNETMFGLGAIPLRDTVKVIHNHKGGMSSIPLIYAKLNGSYHGLLFDNVAPTEVTVRSDNQIVVRSITSRGLKFHLFVGPKPEDIMKDVMLAMGFKKRLEYWMIGAHVCSETTSNNTVTDLDTFINAANSNRLPFDSHCGSVPVVFDSECNTTYVNLVNEGATILKKANKRFMPHVSPYIKYKISDEDTTTEAQSTTVRESLLEFDTKVLSKSEQQKCIDVHKYAQHLILEPDSNNFYQGEVNTNKVLYPIYDNMNEELIKDLWPFNANFDAAVLENNWPLDESKKKVEETKKLLPYYNENFEIAFNLTPPWNARLPNKTWTFGKLLSTSTPDGEKYMYIHNEYGNQFARKIEMINGPIPILSSSQRMNVNVAINRQDVPTSWASLHKELIEASLGGISGHWYWSSPVCGDTEHFNSTIQDKLCAKWYMAATFLPMIKIHSRKHLRDPLAFVGTDRAHMITALTRRISLLPYFYSVLQDGPLLRPMFYQFPFSDALNNLTSQFSVGNDLLIVPNLLPSQTHVHLWLPPGIWYDFWDGLKIIGEEGEVVTMSTTESDFFSMIRGGSIVVMQKDVQLTAELTRRQSNYTLIIALNCKNNTEENLDTSTTTQTSTTSTTAPSPTTTVSTTNVSITTTDTITEEDVTTPKPSTVDDTDNTTTETPDEPDDVIEEVRAKTFETNYQCEATGKFYLSDNMVLIFKANSKSLSIKSTGNDFKILCNDTEALWSNTLSEIIVYGLDDDKNNFDNYRRVTTALDLCRLQTESTIHFIFVD